MSVTLMVQQKTTTTKNPKIYSIFRKTEMANMIKCQPLWTLGGEHMGIYCSTLIFLFLKTSQVRVAHTRKDALVHLRLASLLLSPVEEGNGICGICISLITVPEERK